MKILVILTLCLVGFSYAQDIEREPVKDLKQLKNDVKDFAAVSCDCFVAREAEAPNEEQVCALMDAKEEMMKEKYEGGLGGFDDKAKMVALKAAMSVFKKCKSKEAKEITKDLKSQIKGGDKKEPAKDE